MNCLPMPIKARDIHRQHEVPIHSILSVMSIQYAPYFCYLVLARLPPNEGHCRQCQEIAGAKGRLWVNMGECKSCLKPSEWLPYGRGMDLSLKAG